LFKKILYDIIFGKDVREEKYMLEQIIFTITAFLLFMIIVLKIIWKNDTNYLSVLILQAIAITISFVEIVHNVIGSPVLNFIRYLFGIVIPTIIVLIELKGKNFSEIVSVGLARFYLKIGNTKKAKDILIKHVTKYNSSYLGHKYLAECYEKEGGMRKAIDEYVKAVDIKKNDYKSYFRIASLLKELGKNDEATEMLENLLKNKPDCYEASIILGEILCSTEKFKEAARVYENALAYKPNDFELYYNLGIVYTRLSDFQRAKEMYQMAADINHSAYGVYYSLGLIALIQRDMELAEKYLEDSLYEEYEARSYYQLAKIYAIREEKDKAINFLNKAIEIDNKLLKTANEDPVFNSIRSYITVSVKMEEKNDSGNVDGSYQEELSVMKVEEQKAISYIEKSLELIGKMNSEAKNIVKKEEIKRETELKDYYDLKNKKEKREEYKKRFGRENL